MDARDLKLALSTLKRGSRLSLEWEVREEVQGILVVLFEIFETAIFFKVHFLYTFLVVGSVFLRDFIYYYKR